MSLCWPEFCFDVREVVHIRAECDLSARHLGSRGPRAMAFTGLMHKCLKNKENFLG